MCRADERGLGVWWGSCERQDIAEGGVGSVKECVCVCVVDEKQAGVEGGVCVGLMKEDVYV